MNFRALRDIGIAVCFLLLLLLIALKVNADAGQALTGGLRAVDGDSLARGDERLRLMGIDAPELDQTCRRGPEIWRCGEAAKRALAELMAPPGAVCKGSRRDKYRRLLVTCQQGGRDLNRIMVETGYAVAFGAYEQEEASARARHMGLWSGEFQRPGDWRRAHKATMADEAPHLTSFIGRLLGLD